LIEVVERPAADGPAGALVFLHGYWGIPRDFLPFLDKLDPGRRLHGYLPQAPTHVSEGRFSWEGSGAELEEWLDALPHPPERIVLGGWSQGTWRAYRLALAPGRPRPAGLLALGGRLDEDLVLEPPLPPVLIAHGRDDEPVPVEHARAARDRLVAAGAEVAYFETAIDHRIDQAVVPELRRFVAERL
jgi:phospholipase/carboxylesterase